MIGRPSPCARLVGWVLAAAGVSSAIALVILLAGCAPATHPSRWAGGPTPVPTPQRVSSFVNIDARECEWESSGDYEAFSQCMTAKGFARR